MKMVSLASGACHRHDRNEIRQRSLAGIRVADFFFERLIVNDLVLVSGQSGNHPQDQECADPRQRLAGDACACQPCEPLAFPESALLRIGLERWVGWSRR